MTPALLRLIRGHGFACCNIGHTCYIVRKGRLVPVGKTLRDVQLFLSAMQTFA